MGWRALAMAIVWLVSFSSLVSGQTIQVWIGSAQHQEFIENVYLPKFKERHHEVEVEFIRVPLQDVFDRLLAGVVSGTGPDVIQTGNTSVFNLSNVGLLTPLDRYLEGWSDYSSIWPAAWKNQRFDGVTYGVPMYSAARGIYYRTDTVQTVGLDPGAPPQSWSDILEWARRLTRIDGDRVTRAGYDYQGNYYQEWVFWLNQAGGALITDDLRTPTFNSPPGIDAIEQMLELGRVARFIDLGPPPARGASGLVSDTIGLVIGHSGLISSIVTADPAVAEVTGIFAPRRSPDSPQVALMFTDGWAIPSTSKYPDAAWAFISGLLGREMAAAFINQLGLTVPRNDLMPLIEQSYYIPGYQLLEHAFPYPTLPEGAWLGSAFNEQFSLILNGAQSPQSALELLEAGFTPRVNEYWRSVSR